MTPKPTESDLAANVVTWVREQQWEVYQEVDLKQGSVADIVAVMGRRIWIIECKRSFSFSVMSQAFRWRRHANWCSIAIPAPKQRYDEREFRNQICRDYGIGIIHDGKYDVTEAIPAVLNRKINPDVILKQLVEEHKTYAVAGNSSGKRWTPFQNTCRSILNYVSNHPGCNLESLISSIETHYSSPAGARACISHWVMTGSIRGVRAERDGKHLKFYLAK
jgi:hypothetical protein